MPRRQPDLTHREFRETLIDNGFAWLGRSINKVIDLHHPRRGALDAVLSGKQIDRRATLAALLAARKAAQDEQAHADAERARVVAFAATIAPTALPPCRADLTDEAAVAQLADDFVLGTTSADGITFGALIRKGWSASQLRRHADAARALADRRQIAEVA